MDLVIEAAGKALKDAGLGPDDIDAFYLGNFAGDQFFEQNHLASFAASAVEKSPSIKMLGVYLVFQRSNLNYILRKKEFSINYNFNPSLGFSQCEISHEYGRFFGRMKIKVWKID